MDTRSDGRYQRRKYSSAYFGKNTLTNSGIQLVIALCPNCVKKSELVDFIECIDISKICAYDLPKEVASLCEHRVISHFRNQLSLNGYYDGHVSETFKPLLDLVVSTNKNNSVD